MKIYTIILALCLALIPCWASAQSQPNETLAFDIHIIYAQQSQTATKSAGLEAFAQDFQSGFSGYNDFTLLQKSSIFTQATLPATLTIPSIPPTKLMIAYLAKSAPNTYGIEISLNDQLNAKLKLTQGATFFQAGIPYQNGILIIAITLNKITP